MKIITDKIYMKNDEPITVLFYLRDLKISPVKKKLLGRRPCGKK